VWKSSKEFSGQSIDTSDFKDFRRLENYIPTDFLTAGERMLCCSSCRRGKCTLRWLSALPMFCFVWRRREVHVSEPSSCPIFHRTFSPRRTHTVSGIFPMPLGFKFPCAPRWADVMLNKVKCWQNCTSLLMDGVILWQN